MRCLPKPRYGGSRRRGRRGRRYHVAAKDSARQGGRDDGFVTIKVQDTDRFRVMYTMRKTDRLHALFNFYYDLCS